MKRGATGQWAIGIPSSKLNYGCSNPEENISAELGVAVTELEEWIRRTGLVGPPPC